MLNITFNYNYFLLAILVILVIWQFFLTYKISKIDGIFGRFRGIKNRDDVDLTLKDLLNEISLLKSDIEKIKSGFEEHQADSVNEFRKYALLRYNPFKETGGDQSFVLVLLNKKNDGIIISSLHARDQFRVYAKQIKDGKSVKYELSGEEAKALEEAINSC